MDTVTPRQLEIDQAKRGLSDEANILFEEAKSILMVDGGLGEREAESITAKRRDEFIEMVR